jgi:hypothetical protein
MKFLPRMALTLLVCVWPLSFALAQQLQCSPSSHDYGQVQVGSTVQYTFQLKNSGTSSVTISSKHKTSTDFTFAKFPLPLTLQPGQTSQMKVNFAPSTSGAISANITLNSNAGNPTLTIGVSGTGVTPNKATLGVAPTSLNFGSVTVGSSAKLTLTLSAANGSLTISSAQINSSEFTLTGLTFPKTLASGQSVSATVTFLPNASGTASANLTLISDAANSPTTVPLTGTGVAVKAHSADLTWNASQDIVIGYNVYRGGTKGGPYTKTNPVLDATTSYTDSTVAAGATYYYVVTAVDSGNVESIYSNEVKVLIPTP